MNKRVVRPVAALFVMCFTCLFIVTRTEGFDNIRAVQFLLIFIAGVLFGLALGIIRASRGNRSMQ